MPRTYLLAEIAAHVHGEILGGVNPEIRRIDTLARADSGDLSFLTHRRYRAQLSGTKASAVLIAEVDRDLTPLPRIICADPYLAYAKAASLLYPTAEPVPGIHATCQIHPESSIGAGTQIGAFCSIGKGVSIGRNVILAAGCVLGENVRIGDGSIFHANVTVYADCQLGQRSIIHAGAVIGSDGFGMAHEGERWHKIPQVGRVVIGDDVEIGANTTIDRGALDDTVIEDGVKLDNQIQIGHNVRIGAHSAFAGCVGIAGSATIGRRCTIGGGSVVLGHLEIADDVHIGAASVVTKSIVKAGNYAGLYPLQERSEWARNAALLRNLDKLSVRVREMEIEIERFKRKPA
ncbi:MAG: UDP-3-O-(3-hydroxymyristoyl)glucosamine N-acyltransferase [Burkholderiales bacterium]